MARQFYSATTEGEEALAAATAETVLQVRGATVTKGRLKAWGVSFDGTSVTAEPVRVRLLRQTTDGTGTGATEAKNDPDDPAANITAFHSFTAEPTAGDVLEDREIHPQGGYDHQYPHGEEKVIDADAASRIGIEVTAPAVVNCVAYIQWEE
jgi:hypothetical protein